MATVGQTSKIKRTKSKSALRLLQQKVFVLGGSMHFMMGAVRNVRGSLNSAHIGHFIPYMGERQKRAYDKLFDAVKEAEKEFSAEAIDSLRRDLYAAEKAKLADSPKADAKIKGHNLTIAIVDECNEE